MTKLNMNLCVAVAAFFSGSAIAASFTDTVRVNSRSGMNASATESETKSSMLQLNRAINGGPIFSEDFQGELLPPGWVLVNVDGLTPDPNVAEYIDAWIVREDFDVAGNWTASSTSWYAPAGQSDDWIITPSISVLSNSVLSWRAQAPDANFADGYEVYVSTTTQDVAGCTLDAPIFTTAAEEQVFTLREVNLAAAGYSDTAVFICYRNNSNDKFILNVDDITVVEAGQNDVILDAVANAPEYTQVPDKLLSYDIPLSADFTNAGILDQSNITVEVEVFLDAVSLTTISQVFTGPLSTGNSDSLDFGLYNVSAVGAYDVVYTLTLDGVVDENPADNTATINNVTEITTDTMSRDDGEVNTGTLGIGAGTAGYLGNQYDFNTEVTVSGIQFIHTNNACDPGPECTLDGETLRVDVFMINTTTGLPDLMVGSSEEYIVPAGSAVGTVVNLTFPGNLNLAPGGYVFALAEPEVANSQLHTTENRFTPGTSWVVFPLEPMGTWTNNEDFGFFNTYYMRPKFVETDLIYKSSFE